MLQNLRQFCINTELQLFCEWRKEELEILWLRSHLLETVPGGVVCPILRLKSLEQLFRPLIRSFVVDHTGEVYPGIWTYGMSVSAIFSGPLMGPIFEGMLLSGKRVAELMAAELGETNGRNDQG